MRTCPVTEEDFSPKSIDHFFSDEAAFDKFIAEVDPIDQLQIQKKSRHWEPMQKECKECGKVFTAYHPATVYCEECRNKEEKSDRSEKAIFEWFTPHEKSCVSCGRKFWATHPAMKKCEKCSPSGGRLVS